MGADAESVFVLQYGTQKKAPRLTTKSGSKRHIMFRKRAQGKL
jgi:hypothetical protein